MDNLHPLQYTDHHFHNRSLSYTDLWLRSAGLNTDRPLWSNHKDIQSHWRTPGQITLPAYFLHPSSVFQNFPGSHFRNTGRKCIQTVPWWWLTVESLHWAVSPWSYVHPGSHWKILSGFHTGSGSRSRITTKSSALPGSYTGFRTGIHGSHVHCLPHRPASEKNYPDHFWPVQKRYSDSPWT